MAQTIINHFVGGAEFVGDSDRLGDVFDPALGVATKSVRLATAGDLDAAVQVAKAAFADWSGTSMTKRVQIVFKFRELLEAKKGELAAIITEEHGKVLSDAMGEITRGQ